MFCPEHMGRLLGLLDELGIREDDKAEALAFLEERRGRYRFSAEASWQRLWRNLSALVARVENDAYSPAALFMHIIRAGDFPDLPAPASAYGRYEARRDPVRDEEAQRRRDSGGRVGGPEESLRHGYGWMGEEAHWERYQLLTDQARKLLKEDDWHGTQEHG